MEKFLKKVLAFTCCLSMICILAACGGDDAGNNSSAPSSSPSTTPSESVSVGGNEYAANVFGTDITLALSDSGDSVDIGVSGMTIKGKCSVDGDTLTLTEKTSGNDQIWERLPKTFTLGPDGTAEPVSTEPSEYATNVFDAAVTLTLSDSRDSVDVGVSGMTIQAKCSVDGDTLTLTEKTSGNDQIWERLPKTFVLSSDGTAEPVLDGEPSEDGEEPTDGGEEANYPANTLVLDFQPDANEQLRCNFYVDSSVWGTAFGGNGDYAPTDSAEDLFAWVSDDSENYHLTFHADGSYTYEFTTMGLTETGTWTWSGWTLTATTASGTVCVGEIVK